MHLIIDGLVYSYQRGGISRIYDEILPKMCDLDSSLSIKLILHPSNSKNIPYHPQIRFLRSPDVGKIFRPWRLWHLYHSELRGLLTRIKFTNTKSKVWHSTYYTTLPEWRGPKIISVYDLIHERLGDLFLNSHITIARKRRAISQADVLICISDTTRQDLINFYNVPAEIIHVIHLSHSKAFKVKDEFSFRHSKPFILYVGMREGYKRFSDLLTAYSQWLMNTQIDLVAVGNAWSNSEIDQIKDLNLQNNVYLLNSVDDNMLCDLYNQAEAFVLSSHYEGFGIPLLEAMACGCPMVATRIPSTLEIAGSIPLYYEPGESDDLLVALNKVLLEGKKSSRVQNGLTHVKQFSWNSTAEKTLQLYNWALDK